MLDSVLGFTPGESIVKWIFSHYSGKTVPYKEIERLFILDVRPNYYTGVILSAFDLCNVRVHPGKPIDLPPVSMSGSEYRGSGGSFVDEYIREICIFPTLSREEELELAKLMEVAYIRYKNSICYCPAVLDFLDNEFREIRDVPAGGHDFNLPRLKSLIVSGSNSLSYDQVWKLIDHQWQKIMDIRGKIKELGLELYHSEDVSAEDKITLKHYKFAVSFLLKDLNIKESIFHEMRTTLSEVEAEYPHLKSDFKRVHQCYDSYIECKNLLVNYNLKLVVSIARKFFRPKVSPMDVIQYGNEGLIRAAEDYNYKLKFKFSTYAIWWIRQKIQEGIQEQEHLIRIPAYRLHLSRKYSAIKKRLSQEGEGVVTDEMLSEELEMTVDQVKKLRSDPSAFVISPQGSEDEDQNVLEQLVDSTSGDDDKTYDEDATGALKSHLKLYPARERFILTLRYGLSSDDIVPQDMSFSEVEDQFNRFDENMTDKELDESFDSLCYQFMGLPTEVKIPVEDFREIKKVKKTEVELVRSFLPFTDEELQLYRQQKRDGAELEVSALTILALVDGIDFSDMVSFKSRDRLILNKIWLKVHLKPSVIRKILNHEGLILEDVARVFSLTKERVRQIEAKILRNISYHLVLP